MLFVNVPSVLDDKMRVRSADGGHVLSLEVLFTPYELKGGWRQAAEPERWIDALDTLLEPGFRSSIRDWRVMTPESYEDQFNLRRGHAPSFSGGAVAALLGEAIGRTSREESVSSLFE